MNRLEELNTALIHTRMVRNNDEIMLFYPGDTLKEAMSNLILEGTAWAFLDYSPSQALDHFSTRMLCMSRSDEDFVYLEKIEDETRLCELMDRFFDDSEDALASQETLYQFISDYNEAGLSMPQISEEEKQAILDECQKLADIVWISNVKYTEKQQAEYVLSRIDAKETSDLLMHWMRYWIRIIDADDESITVLLDGPEDEKEGFIKRREEAETLLNEMMKASFPQDYHYRRLILMPEDRKPYGRKEIKIITINEGNKPTIRSEPWFTVIEAEKTAECVQEYLRKGWKIIHCFPDFNPAIQKEGAYTFYKGGFTFVMEREL